VTNLSLCNKRGLRVQRQIRALTLVALFSGVAQGAGDISGTVVNQSRGEPAAGDDVILVQLDPSFDEEAHAKTDAHGRFTLPVRYPDKRYLVRVVRQGVSYDQRASAGDALVIAVFDTARKVRDVTGTIEILRAGVEGNLLHVSDMYEIRNTSNPPLTETGGHTFDAYLPANAQVDSVLAAGPGKLGVLIAAAPVSGQPGHCAVDFPLRPGATRFAFNYDLPYDGHATFETRHAYPLEQLAIMIPPTMKFSSRAAAFEILPVDSSRYQVLAANHLKAGEGPEFEIFGAGDLPSVGNQDKSEAWAHPPLPSHATSLALGPIVEPSLAWIDSRSKPIEPPSQSLALRGVISVLLALCAVLIWRVRTGLSSDRHGVRRGHPSKPGDIACP